MRSLHDWNQSFGTLQATSSAYAGAAGASDAQVLLFADLQTQGFLIAQVFFGLWLFPIGFMFLRSGYAPKVLAVLVMIAAGGYLGDVVTSTLSPATGDSLAPVFIVINVVGEGALALWLLIKGLNFDSRVNLPMGGAVQSLETAVT